MSNSPLRLAMVGCGAFSRRYHLPAIEADKGVALAAIFDPTPVEAVRDLAARHGAVLTSDLAAALAPGVADAAIVTTPHALHAQHIDAVLAAGLHVLVDKPFVVHSEDACRLAEAATAAGKVAAVAFNRRFDASCLRARAIVAGGTIGDLAYVETVQLGWERAGWFLDPTMNGPGPFMGRLTHMADIVPWITARAPRRLRCVVKQALIPGRTDRGGVVDVDLDGLECRFTCLEDGLHMWDEIRLFGEDGLVELRRPLNLPIGWQLSRRDRTQEVETLAADAAPGDATRDFFAAIRGGGRPTCSFADAWLSVRVVEAAYQSAEAGGAWIEI
jgi:predicted dehydrogenase